MTVTYPFTAEDARAAYDSWGCNCGPSALAFALQVPLDRIRGVIPQFEERRYTSPTMMRAALDALGVSHRPALANRQQMFGPMALVRVQWTGPWTAPGTNPKWKYRQTHWIATWLDAAKGGMVFDVNGGMLAFGEWETVIVPLLTKATPRADGKWYATHVWRVGARAAGSKGANDVAMA